MDIESFQKIPPGLKIIGVEMIRDGGSLYASYSSDDGCSYTLGFPIEWHDGKRTGYLQPFFGRFVIVMKDGLRVGHRHENVFSISWIEAKTLLERSGDSFQSEWYARMLKVAEKSGDVTFT